MESRIRTVFEAQKKNQWLIGNTSVSQRRQKLKKLKKAIEITYRQEIRDALYNDMRKSQSEADLTEIYMVTSEIKHALRSLGSWMAKEAVATPLPLLGSSSWIRYEPKGVCLIISPWNFPINLTFGPLVSAVAAGNTVMLKPSEHTPHCSALMEKIIQDVFDENEVALFQGGIEVATELLSLPFNHIFFTGSPRVGKIVMAAASKHLASVTLELGGKSPTIIDKTAKVSMTAKRIAWGKFLNSGQICIAPDYVLVHKDIAKTFVTKLQYWISRLYTENPQTEESYNRMVNASQMARVASSLKDTISKGAEIVVGGNHSKEDMNYFAPTIVLDADEDSELMKEEIFGPVLPIKTFDKIETAVEFVNGKEKPLALYIYSENKSNIRYLIQNTRAGGSCINHNDIHYFNLNLPFGGSNNSGIGKSHGIFGFKSFSNARGVYKQNFPGSLELLLPPYNTLKEKIIELTIKWL